MTKAKKKRRLSHEILGLIGLCAVISLLLFLLLSGIATAAVEEYCFNHEIPMTEFDWIRVDRLIFTGSAILACCGFTVLFLSLLADRIAYIRKITAGIDRLHVPDAAVSIPLEGNNELTTLAAAINDMSEARQQIRIKEQALAAEKEELIRTLSHDIRTPLTSILAYSDYLAEKEEVTTEEQKTYLQLIRKKAEQIRDLSAILLDGSRRAPEYFENGKLLFEQIAAEFEEELEERFRIITDFSACPEFSGTFDVQELRRIFDNLISNVQKYADPEQPVTLQTVLRGKMLYICQTNGILAEKPQVDSYRIGLNSIRRIAQLYDGSVTTNETADRFSITVTFSIL